MRLQRGSSIIAHAIGSSVVINIYLSVQSPDNYRNRLGVSHIRLTYNVHGSQHFRCIPQYMTIYVSQAPLLFLSKNK